MLIWPTIFVVSLLLLNALGTSGSSALQHRSPSPPVTLPLYSYAARALGNETTTSSGITSVTIASDKQSYYAVIKAGEINFRVALDTGSADLWILSSGCTTSSCKAVPRYPLAYESATFVTVNDNSTVFSASYLDGTGVSGFVARETIQLANVTLANQAFGMVTASNLTMVDDTSGIMGLGFPRLSTIPSSVTNSTPFFPSLAEHGLLDYPLFGLSLTRSASGTLTLGAIDSLVVTNVSSISWHKVVEFAPIGSESNTSSYLQWAIPIAGFGVNGTRLVPSPTYPNITGNSSIALFDVGTAGIYGPYQDVSRLFGLIDGARLVDASGQWVVPCDVVVPMSFTFGTTSFTLQPTDYLIGPAFGNPNLCLSWPRALPPSPDGIDWQMGTAFMRTVYSIFSYGINSKESPLIGLYPLQNTTNITESAGSVASFLSSESATIATTLPNSLIATPTYTTPAYFFNSSIHAPTGGIVPSELATSTYDAIFGKTNFNVTALPTVALTPTLLTLILTDGDGSVTGTSTSTVSAPSVTLGVPPGWNAATSFRIPYFAAFTLCSIISFILIGHYL